MNDKLTTTEQVKELSVGDIIKKFPTDYKPEEFFDDRRAKDIDTYKIRSINKTTGIIELSMTGDSIIMFASPVDVGHLYLKHSDFLEQKVWWK